MTLNDEMQTKINFETNMCIEEDMCTEFGPESDEFFHARQKGELFWILKHVFYKRNKYFIVFWFVITVIASYLSSYIMIYLGRVIETLRTSTNVNLIQDFEIILLIGLGSSVLGLFANFSREILAQRIERDTRNEFYLNILGKSQSFHDKQRIGDLMARATSDVRLLNFLISPAISLIFESITSLLIPIIFVFVLYPMQLVLIPILFVIAFGFSLRRYVNQLGPVVQNIQIEFGNLNATLNESLAGIEVVKSMAKEQHSILKYHANAKHFRDLAVQEGIIQAKYLPILLVALTTTLGLGHAIIMEQLQLITIGEIIAYVGLLLQFRFPTFISIWAFATLRRAVAGAHRLLEKMNSSSEIGNRTNAITKTIEGKVEFRNVSFSYPESDTKVLKNINFTILPGQTVAIVGTTGSGKTTLTKLLARLYNLNEGEICIDDINITHYSLESLRSQIAFIEQDVFLFSNSIRENIVFGQDVSPEQIEQSAKDAQAYQFIQDLPKGFDSEIGERGVQLSGGERQRIAIARAFLSDPHILVLDDSTSAIDSETEEQIQTAISHILKGRTTFLITHRLSQIRWADQILVLKKGEIQAFGPHQQLLRESKEYQKIFVKKFDKNLEELLGENQK